MMLFIAGSFYATMVIAGWLTELIFGAIGFVPQSHHVAAIAAQHVSFNYTTVLNIIFVALGGWLVYRFIRTGALPMLKMMGGGPSDPGSHH
jgi:hypothetical protein